MIQQPVLTDFPCTVFATAKRRGQAAMQQLRQKLIKDSICGYALIFQSVLPGSFLASIDPTTRQGNVPE